MMRRQSRLYCVRCLGEEIWADKAAKFISRLANEKSDRNLAKIN